MAEDREPRIRIAPASLLLVVLFTGVGAAALAALITVRLVARSLPVDPAAPDPMVSSLLGSLAAMLVSLPVLAAIQPWKVRPAGTWATIWLGSTVGRLLLMPVVGLAVYSATLVRTDAFLLSLAGTYLACLAAEVAISARSVARSLAAADADARRPLEPS